MKSPKSRPTVIVSTIFIVLTLVGGAFALLEQWHSASTNSEQTSIGGPFTLVTGDGMTVTEQTFRDKWLLIYFGYTYCPDACPTTLNDIAEALTRLGPLAEKVQPLFISIDPDRDTPEVIGKYVKSFDPRIVGLTGTAEQISKVASEFHVYYAVHRTGNGPDDYAMDHSSIIYVMNSQGRYAAAVSSGQTPDALASRLRQLMTSSS